MRINKKYFAKLLKIVHSSLAQSVERAVWLHTLTQTIDFGENKQKIFAKLLKIVHSSLAQSVEHAAVNRRVVGSSPTGGAT